MKNDVVKKMKYPVIPKYGPEYIKQKEYEKQALSVKKQNEKEIWLKQTEINIRKRVEDYFHTFILECSGWPNPYEQEFPFCEPYSNENYDDMFGITKRVAKEEFEQIDSAGQISYTFRKGYFDYEDIDLPELVIIYKPIASTTTHNYTEKGDVTEKCGVTEKYPIVNSYGTNVNNEIELLKIKAQIEYMINETICETSGKSEQWSISRTFDDVMTSVHYGMCKLYLEPDEAFEAVKRIAKENFSQLESFNQVKYKVQLKNKKVTLTINYTPYCLKYH